MIASLAPGRFAIGLGTGPLKAADPKLSMQRWGLEWDRSVPRMREYIEVLRRVLAGEQLTYDGEFHHLRNVGLDIEPPSDSVEIFVAAGGQRMAEMAAAEADGLFLHLANENVVGQWRATIDRVAQAAGRDPSAIALGNLVMTCVDDDAALARAAMRRYLVSFYLNMPSYQRLLHLGGFTDDANAIAGCVVRGDQTGAESAVSDALLEELTITGTPAECRDKLRNVVAGATDLPIVYPFPSTGDWIEGYRSAVRAFARRPD